MIYISAQPDNLRFIWEQRVQLTNFRQVGVDLSCVHVLFAKYGDNLTVAVQNLCKDFPEVNFFFYEDKRIDRSYIPSLKPHLFTQHLQTFPLLESEDFFYYDSDIIFRELPDFSSILSRLNETEWLGSQTGHYLSTEYIKSKGDGLLEEMCLLVGVDKDVIDELYSKSVPGAQWLIRKPTAKYWEKVTIDCQRLYGLLTSTAHKYRTRALEQGLIQSEEQYLPIQAWTAEMWAQVWNATLFGFTTSVEAEFDFCWATCHIDRWSQTKIMHNAGVTEASRNELFFKGDFFLTEPFYKDLSYVKKDRCSSKYVEQILISK